MLVVGVLEKYLHHNLRLKLKVIKTNLLSIPHFLFEVHLLLIISISIHWEFPEFVASSIFVVPEIRPQPLHKQVITSLADLSWLPSSGYCAKPPMLTASIMELVSLYSSYTAATLSGIISAPPEK